MADYGLRFLRDQIRFADVFIWKGDDRSIGSNRDPGIISSDQFAGEVATSFVIAARADLCAAANEAAKMVWLCEWAFWTGRRNLKSVLLSQRPERAGHALAYCEVYSIGMIDVNPNGAAVHFTKQQLDRRL